MWIPPSSTICIAWLSSLIPSLLLFTTFTKSRFIWFLYESTWSPMHTLQQSTISWIHDTYASSNRSCGFAFIFCWTLVRNIVVLPGLSVQCKRTSSSRKLMCSFPVPYVLDSSNSMTKQHAQSNKSINSYQMTVCVEKQIWGDSKPVVNSTILYVIRLQDSYWIDILSSNSCRFNKNRIRSKRLSGMFNKGSILEWIRTQIIRIHSSLPKKSKRSFSLMRWRRNWRVLRSPSNLEICSLSAVTKKIL